MKIYEVSIELTVTHMIKVCAKNQSEAKAKGWNRFTAKVPKKHFRVSAEKISD